MGPEVIKELIVALPALLLSLSVHEFAHAWVATRLGDPTPVRQGRLTLSPLAHIDLFGTIIFPVMLALLNARPFGWAKPVEFQPVNFTRKVTLWQGTALTAAAGPLSNLLLAFVSALGLSWFLSSGVSEVNFGVHFLSLLFKLNVLLAVFNLFPLPPLDGGHLIPDRFRAAREFLQRYSFVLFMAFFFIPLPGLGGPLGFVLISPIIQVLENFLATLAGLG